MVKNVFCMVLTDLWPSKWSLFLMFYLYFQRLYIICLLVGWIYIFVHILSRILIWSLKLSISLPSYFLLIMFDVPVFWESCAKISLMIVDLLFQLFLSVFALFFFLSYAVRQIILYQNFHELLHLLLDQVSPY